MSALHSADAEALMAALARLILAARSSRAQPAGDNSRTRTAACVAHHENLRDSDCQH